MIRIPAKHRFEQVRLIMLAAIVACGIGWLLSAESGYPPVHAFSSGPPAGYTGAPLEEPEACAECHVPPDAGTGQISISVPATYIPGQTYQISINHINPDPTRQRWGFQLTVLDGGDEKAGNLQSTDVFTQVLDNQGPSSSRQYIEHTSVGTFPGQQNGATWTFSWTAPATDAGPVIFYAAGNHANNDNNTSGDHIYRTFVAVAPASTTADFAITTASSAQTVTPGGAAQYVITVAPLAGFSGNVDLSASGLPAGVTAGFSPSVLTFSGTSAKTSALTLTTSGATPIGTLPVTVTGTSGATSHSVGVMLKVVSSTNVDLAVQQTVSPNPAQVGVGISYRIVVGNDGPAVATDVTVMDTLPPGVAFGSVSASQGTCSGNAPVNCVLGNLNPGETALITIVVTPSAPGQLANSVSVNSGQTDHDSTNNTSSLDTVVQAAAALPVMLDPNLTVSTVVSGLNQPTSMAFLNANEFLVLERATGRVQRVVNGVVQNTVLDLAVNSASERGLLGIALHPNFFLNGFVYLFWSESSTGSDTTNVDQIALLGNRVDRFLWNGSVLTFDRNLIRLRAIQQDGGQGSRGNHNGGVLRFGPDGKLYVLFGDVGRRGFMQNVTTGGVIPDDQFGGPEPDDAHLTGVVLRLNDDGSPPTDNPFFSAATNLTGEAAVNIRKIFAYGVRNGFGMAFDPLSGSLWTQENGDDSFDELNRVTPGFNGGWVQAMGPIGRIDEFKSIETSYGSGNLQQLRWPASNIAATPQLALSSMYMLPGASYRDPEFSWKYAVAPAALGFVEGRGLGPQFEGNMFVGASRTTLANGYLFRFKLGADRQHFSFNDPKLADLVADNADKFDLTESEGLLIGRDFGVTTDIQSAPNGNVFVVSLSNGAVYEIESKPSELFVATLNGAQEVPATNSPAMGTATLLLSPDETTARVSVDFSGLTSSQTDTHIHGPAPVGVSASALFPLPLGQISDFEINLTPNQVQDLRNGLLYVNVHTSNFIAGEIRGQFDSSATASSVQFGATSFFVNEGEKSATISVSRIGNNSDPISVGYLTTDVTANNRTDYITTAGTLHFLAGELFKTFTIPIVDDLYVEGSETIGLTLKNPAGSAFAGSPTTASLTIIDNDTVAATVNPLDDPEFFVNQQYLDFLNRSPDPGGFVYWTNEIASCGTNVACIVSRRVGVSGAFFVESEFQEGGNFVIRLYKATLGRQPTYAEFSVDRGQIIEGPDLEMTKVALVNAFITRAEFVQQYPAFATNAEFVNKLFDTMQLFPFTAERQVQINLMNGGKTRAQVVRDVVEISAFRSREFNHSFVLMQYFGYLRRDPDPGGYAFWLDIVNNREPNNFRGLICAFLTSREYQERFSPVVSRTDAECAMFATP